METVVFVNLRDTNYETTVCDGCTIILDFLKLNWTTFTSNRVELLNVSLRREDFKQEWNGWAWHTILQPEDWSCGEDMRSRVTLLDGQTLCAEPSSLYC